MSKHSRFPKYLADRIADMLMIALGFWAAKQMNNSWNGLLTIFIAYSLMLYPMFWVQEKLFHRDDVAQGKEEDK
jgi:hypothetical protein